jgi:hypothetical protein
MSGIGEATEIESRFVIARVGIGWEETANGYDVSFRADEDVLKLDSGDLSIKL